jgi:hypothetical protein
MRRVQRWDDPNLDLVAHARAVVRGAAELGEQARGQMIAAIGLEPDDNASPTAIARQFLATRGIRA